MRHTNKHCMNLFGYRYDDRKYKSLESTFDIDIFFSILYILYYTNIISFVQFQSTIEIQLERIDGDASNIRVMINSKWMKPSNALVQKANVASSCISSSSFFFIFFPLVDCHICSSRIGI